MSGSGVSPAFTAFQQGWEAELADFPLPAFSPGTKADFRVNSRVARVHDVAITELNGASVIRTDGPLGGPEDVVRLYAVKRGAWTLGGPHERGERTITAGQFLLKHVGRPSHFETVPDTAAKVLVLPAAVLKPLLAGRIIAGPESRKVRPTSTILRSTVRIAPITPR